MADGRFSFLSFILWLISNLISCFQANLALLILQADYSRRRQNIIRLLSLPVSRGGRLDLPLVWLCFCPDFDILNCFCDFEERHNNINPHQTKFKDSANLLFRGLLTANTSRVKHTQSGKLSFSNRFTVYVWTGENDARTLRVDASVFENEKKNCVFKRIRIRVDRAWIKPTPAEIHGRARREELLEPFQIETSVPNWFRRRTFHVLMHCIRSGSWKVGRLNRALSFYAQCLLAFLSF